MAIFHGNSIPAAGGNGYNIDNSLRFTETDSPNLSFTPSSAGNRKKYTISFWFKRGNGFFTNGTRQHVLCSASYSGGAACAKISFWDDCIYVDEASVTFEAAVALKTLLRDTSSWYHIVLAVDTTQSTSSDRIKLYLNGSQKTEITGALPSLNADCGFTNNTVHRIGSNATVGQYFDGYISEFNLVDGQQLTPSDFGETGDYGEWIPKAYEGTHGTNGCYLDFKDSNIAHNVAAVGNTQHSTTIKKFGNSSVYFDGSGAGNGNTYLQVTDHADFDFGTTNDFTIEGWIYQTVSATSGYNAVWQTSDADGHGIGLMWHGDGRLQLQFGTSASGWESTDFVGTYNNNQWYHVAEVRSSGTVKFYVDGVQKYSATRNGNYDGNQSLKFGGWRPVANGAEILGNTFHGYMDEMRISNNARYTSAFTPSTTAFTVDTNTLLLIQSDTTNGSTTFLDSAGVSGGLGHDGSANSNHFTLTNIDTTDQMLDSPTNNFAVMNTLDNTMTSTFTEGNLKIETGASPSTGRTNATFGVTTGKWYWEYLLTFGSDNGLIGIGECGDTGAIGSSANDYVYQFDGTKKNNGSGSSYGLSSTTNDVVGVALDLDSGTTTLTIYKNGSSLGTMYSSLNSGITYLPNVGDINSTSNLKGIFNFGQDGTFAGNVSAGGNADSNSYGNFKYAPPAGFLSLCSANLPVSTVVPNEHFNTVLYTGTAAVQSITGVGFQPDLIWGKQRNGTNAHAIVDSVRGNTKYLSSQRANAEDIQTDVVTSFDSDGFTLGQAIGFDMNHSGSSLVAWSWNAGTSVSGNTSGSGTSKTYTGSVNAAAGFSIIKYIGNGTAGHTIPHHLGAEPDMMIIKGNEDTNDWYVYGRPIGNTKGMQLSTSAAANTTNEYWDNTSPTSTVFTTSFNPGNNRSNFPNIAYCFRNIEGYSKVGSYNGNGLSDGTFIYTGFRPGWIMTKCISSSSSWIIWDTERSTRNVITNDDLQADLNQAEGAGSWGIHMDILSNGYKFRNADNNAINASGQSYLYLAFADQPFKNANAR